MFVQALTPDADLDLVTAQSARDVARVAANATKDHRDTSLPADRLEAVASDAVHVADEAREGCRRRVWRG